MKRIVTINLVLVLVSIFSITAFAGNKDRTGQAGAGELLLNPWSKSGGVFGLNGACVMGLEAMKCNVAGLSKIKKTEIGIAHTRYLAGTGMSISNLGIAQNLGEIGVLGVNIMSFGYGEINITQENAPEGGLGTYKPQFFNMSVALGHTFSKSISGGACVTFVNEAITNLRASAIGFDAGVQYTSGQKDNFHLGITLRNVGTNLRFSGDGFSFNGLSPDQSQNLTVQPTSDKFQLPTQLNLALAYDFYLNEKSVEEGDAPSEVANNISKHRITPMFSFISNSFNNDFIGVGAEYAYKEKFHLRAAYRYEKDIFSKENTTTLYTGIAVGAGFQTKLSKNDGAPSLAIDYSFKPTRIGGSVHALGFRFCLNSKDNKED